MALAYGPMIRIRPNHRPERDHFQRSSYPRIVHLHRFPWLLFLLRTMCLRGQRRLQALRSPQQRPSQTTLSARQIEIPETSRPRGPHTLPDGSRNMFRCPRSSSTTTIRWHVPSSAISTWLAPCSRGALQSRRSSVQTARLWICYFAPGKKPTPIPCAISPAN